MKVHRKQIIELARHDPIVCAVLNYWHRGDLTWEEAMMVCVSELAKQNETLMENYKKTLMSTTVPMIPLPPDYRVHFDGDYEQDNFIAEDLEPE